MQKKRSEPANMNMKVQLTAAFVALLVLLAAFGRSTAVSNAEESSPLAMPEEYVNYTISHVNGVLWAKIDGTYPISYSGNDAALPLFYPTPPGTTNISVRFDEVEVEWTNFAEFSPELHHTVIGDWSMIYCVLAPVPEQFVLRIHYEHPVEVINGSYVFLYDLNIKEYLSASENRSLAHFTINMDTDYSNLKVSTVFGPEETLKPIEFTVSGENPVEIRVDEVSELGKPLPGDLLISFSEANPQEPDGNVWVAVFFFVVGLVVAGLAFLGFRRRRKRSVV